MKLSRAAILVVLCVTSALAEESKQTEAKPKSLAARNAIEKCDTAIADAEKAYQKAVLDAKFKMNIDLRKAQQNALAAGEQEEALSIAEVIKKTESDLNSKSPAAHSRSGAGQSLDRAALVGTNWQSSMGWHVVLQGDGMIKHSWRDATGTWNVTGDRTLTIVFDQGYVDIWKIDSTGKSWKAVSYRREREYDVSKGR